MKLKDIKDYSLIDVSEHAAANKISIEPAFAWWVPDNLRTKTRIINAVKSWYWDGKYMFGLELSKSVKEALDIDAATNTDFWK